MVKGDLLEMGLLSGKAPSIIIGVGAITPYDPYDPQLPIIFWSI